MKTPSSLRCGKILKMDIESIREYCIRKKAVTECFPFDEYNLVFKVVDRMFALINLENPDRIFLKCEPEYAIELRDRYNGIEGAFHFNKKHWNQVYVESDVSDSLIKELIDHSYNEVIKKFTRKQREQYNELS